MLPTTFAHTHAPVSSPAHRLSPDVALGLSAATQALHAFAWRIGQVAIDLQDCETIAANVILAYLEALEATRDAQTRKQGGL